MPTFEYQAQRADGSIENGLVEGPTLDGAAMDLASKGLRVTQIGFHSPQMAPIATQGTSPYSYGGERSAAEPTARRFDPAPPERTYVETSVMGPLVGRVPLEQIGFFFRQLSTMLRAGVGIVQSLNTLANQARDPRLATILREVAGSVEAGRPMTSVLQRYPEVFTPVMVSVVKAGEEGGFMDQSLATVADYIDQEIELRSLYRRATFWPKLELVASILIIVTANAIIDGINPSAEHLKSPLTTLTTWYVLGPLALAVYLFLRVGLANPDMKAKWDQFIANVPFLGNTLRQIAMARFGRAFGALYAAGVPLQRALLLAADACGNEYLRGKMYPAYRQLQAGQGVTETLESTQAFSPIVMDMIRTGETTGNLDQMLTRSSDFYIEEAKVRQHQLGMVVGLFLSLVVAIYIGYVVINFYLSHFAGIGSGGGG